MEATDVDPLTSTGGQPGVRFNFRFAWSYDVDRSDPSYDGRLDPTNTEDFDIDLYYEMFPDMSYEERDRLEEYCEARDYFDYDPLSEDVLDRAHETDFDFIDSNPLEPTDHSESAGHLFEENPFTEEITPLQDTKRDLVAERFQTNEAKAADGGKGVQNTDEKHSTAGEKGESQKPENSSGSASALLSPQHASALKQLKLSASKSMAKQIGSAQASSLAVSQSTFLTSTPMTTSAIVTTSVQTSLVMAVAYVAVTSAFLPESPFAVGTTFANFMSSRVIPANLTAGSQSFLSPVPEVTPEVSSFTQSLSSETLLGTDTILPTTTQATTVGNIFATRDTTEIETLISTPVQLESSTEFFETTGMTTGSTSTFLSESPTAPPSPLQLSTNVPTDSISAKPSASPLTSSPTVGPTSSEKPSAFPTEPISVKPSTSPSTSSPTVAPTLPEEPSSLPTDTMSYGPSTSPSTSSPTVAPTSSEELSVLPTEPISAKPSTSPSQSSPTAKPTSSEKPSALPTESISTQPSTSPSTSYPTAAPTLSEQPSSLPTESISAKPSISPSESSTTVAPMSSALPTESISAKPSISPSESSPTVAPTSSEEPSALPTESISAEPSTSPSEPSPSSQPTASVSEAPSVLPTESISAKPSISPSEPSPSSQPTASVSKAPSVLPTKSISSMPSISPSEPSPSNQPTDVASSAPSTPPTERRTEVPSHSPSETSPSSHPTQSLVPTFSPTQSVPPTTNPTMAIVCPLPVSIQSPSQELVSKGQNLVFTMAGLVGSLGDVDLTVFARGDLGISTEFVDIFVDGVNFGRFFDESGSHDNDCTEEHIEINLSLEQNDFNSFIAPDGTLEVTVAASEEVDAFCSDSDFYVQITYTSCATLELSTSPTVSMIPSAAPTKSFTPTKSSFPSESPTKSERPSPSPTASP